MEQTTYKTHRTGQKARQYQGHRLCRTSCVAASLGFLSGLAVLICGRLSSSQWAGSWHPSLTLDYRALERSLAILRNASSMFHVVSESVVYSRYARVYSRKLRHPDGKEFEYDVWGRNWRNDSFAVVCVVPFDSSDMTFTLVREYSVAHGMLVYSFPQGCYETGKHASPQAAAEAELDEEARLRCKKSSWIPLLDTPAGSPQDKFQREKVHYFLCADVFGLEEGDARQRDAEENINIERGISVAQLKALMRAGVMQSNNIAAGMLAINRLRLDGSLPMEA
jgi:8-oxo-dGTP pyrophosphatase MutT (NUDIX family)